MQIDWGAVLLTELDSAPTFGPKVQERTQNMPVNETGFDGSGDDWEERADDDRRYCLINNLAVTH